MSASIEKWLCRRLLQAPAPDKVALRHLSAESGESELLARATLKAGDPSQIARVTATELFDQAYEHCKAFPGRPQRYKVVAIVKGKASDSTAFLVRAEGSLSGSPVLDGSEPPTPQGLLSQHMRFTESLIRMALEHSGHTIEDQRREIDALRGERERDLVRRIKSIETLEEILDKAADRKMAQLKAERQDARKDLMANEVIKRLMPGLERGVPKMVDSLLGPSRDDVLGRVQSILSRMPSEERERFLLSLDKESRDDLEYIVSAFDERREQTQ